MEFARMVACSCPAERISVVNKRTKMNMNTLLVFIVSIRVTIMNLVILYRVFIVHFILFIEQANKLNQN